MRKILSPIWLLAVFTVLLSGCLSSRSTGDNAIDPLVPEAMAAQTNTVVRVLPVEQQLDTGNITTVNIQIDSVTNLVAAEVEFHFTPSVLQALDSNPNQEGIQMQPNEAFLSGFIINSVDNQTGVAKYAVTQLAPFEPVSGSGILASISFRAVAQGTSEIPFVVVNLSNENVELIPSTSEPGKIIVSGGVVVTPTPTATVDPNLPTSTVTSTPTATNSPTITSTPTETFTPPPTNTLIPPTATLTPIPTNTPVPSENYVPPGATLGFCTQIRPGDSLQSLGMQYGMDPNFISTVNDLYPPGHVIQNQTIFMPTTYGSGPNTYISEPYDTLEIIAERCKIPVTMLAKYNNLPTDANIETGHALIIPIPPYPPPSQFPYNLPIVPIPNPCGSNC